MDHQLLLQQYDRSESCRLTIRMKEEEEEKEKIDILPDSVCLNERKTANKQTNTHTHQKGYLRIPIKIMVGNETKRMI